MILFMIFVFVLIIGVVLKCINKNWELNFIAETTSLLGGILIFFSFIFFMVNSIAYDAQLESNKIYKDNLVYQLEHQEDLNGLGRKNLYDQVTEWNRDVTQMKIQKNNPWINWYIQDFSELGKIDINNYEVVSN